MAARQELEDANVGQQQQTAPVPARPPTHDGQDTVDDAPQPVPGPAVAPAPAQAPPLDQQEQLLQLTRQMLQQLAPHLRRNPERNAFGEWLIECLHNLPNDLYREACKEFQGIMNRYNNEGAARRSGHQQQPSTSFELDSRPPQLSRGPAGPPPPLAGTSKSPTPTMQQDPGWQPAPYLWNQPSARQQQQAQQQHFSVWNSQDYDYVHQNYPNLYPPRCMSCPPQDSSGNFSFSSLVSGGARSSAGFSDFLAQNNQQRDQLDQSHMPPPSPVSSAPSSSTATTEATVVVTSQSTSDSVITILNIGQSEQQDSTHQD